MKKYILKKKAPILIITLCLSFSHSLLADNFYYFIDLNTAFNVNQDKQLTTLNISWSYDENISALMRQHNPDLKTLGTAIINDLGKNHYFINIQFNGKPVETGRVEQYSLQPLTHHGNTDLQLNFTLPLQKPLNLKGKNTLTWNFADPAGIAIMVYDDQENIQLGYPLKSHCKTIIKYTDNAEYGDPEQLLTLYCSIQ